MKLGISGEYVHSLHIKLKIFAENEYIGRHIKTKIKEVLLPYIFRSNIFENLKEKNELKYMNI